MKDFFANLHCSNNKYFLSKWQIICIGLGCYVVFIFLIDICTKLYTVFGFEYRTVLRARSNMLIDWGNLWGTLFYLIIAPVIEETAWRLGISFKKHHVAISLGVTCMYIPRIFVGMRFLSPFSLSLIGLGLMIYCIIVRYTNDQFWIKIKKKYSKYIVWILIIAFTMLHLHNYNAALAWEHFFAYILILSRSFFMAVTATYLRLNLGFFYAVIVHIACNSGIILRI